MKEKLVKQFSQFQRASRRGSSTPSAAVRLYRSQRDAGTEAAQHAPASADRLDSWKEIASYLDREVRTAQRWEKRESLPVHRHLHHTTSSVYAYKTEIDKWRDTRSPIPSPSGSPTTDPIAVRGGARLAAQLEQQLMEPCKANNRLARRTNVNLINAIIFIATELPVRPKEVQSLPLCKVLTCGLPAKSRRVAGLPVCLCRSRAITKGDCKVGGCRPDIKPSTRSCGKPLSLRGKLQSSAASK
jgi:hypothetical protein